ncbi:MAG: 2-phospho-L-lactate/phosphoenolpyruvate guanylyltransferase [Gaiellaceae bacterium]|nr:2-phospho-L-lactate/phosphoenolpyruvate guanylyltransferase [Gaiellaceae bacterium]
MHVLVPVKRLDRCKQRLSGVLDAGQRRLLMLALLEDALAQALLAGRATAVTVVTDDRLASQVARAYGAGSVSDGGLPWNAGLQHALGLLGPGPDGVLFLSADLPTIVADDVDAMIAACPPRGIAIGRAHDEGTNALALRPHDGIVPAFGSPRSSAVHAALARAAGIDAVQVDRPGLALDLDTPDDLNEALAADAFADRAWRAVVAETCPC